MTVEMQTQGGGVAADKRRAGERQVSGGKGQPREIGFLSGMSPRAAHASQCHHWAFHFAPKTGLSPVQHDYVRKISDSGVSLSRIINGILDFSKIEAGKLEMEQTLFRLDDALSSVIAVVEQKAVDKEDELLLDVSPEIPW